MTDLTGSQPQDTANKDKKIGYYLLGILFYKRKVKQSVRVHLVK